MWFAIIPFPVIMINFIHIESGQNNEKYIAMIPVRDKPAKQMIGKPGTGVVSASRKNNDINNLPHAKQISEIKIHASNSKTIKFYSLILYSPSTRTSRLSYFNRKPSLILNPLASNLGSSLYRQGKATS